MSDLPHLTREQILWILNGLPESPEALSHIDVKQLIYGTCASKTILNDVVDLNYFVEEIFDHLLTIGWMEPAQDFPKAKDGKFYYYRRASRGQDAIDNGLIGRRPQWV